MATLDRKKFAALKKQHEQGLIVGLSDVAGSDKFRLDVDVLLKSKPKTFNLFLLALDKLQNMDFNNRMGYYQIAGIHGFPKVRWDGVGGKYMGTDRDAGYCAHGTPTFPTWHRPYLAMLEQALFISMVEIADLYDDSRVRAEYEAAILEFRLPYWDYFRPRGGAVSFPGIVDDGVLTAYRYDYKLPEICTIENVMVRKPGDNSLETMRNPLHHFNFKDKSSESSEMNWSFLNSRQGFRLNRERTSRHPWPPGQQDVIWDNPARLNKVLNELRMDTNRIALDMISEDYYKVFESFSTAGLGRGVPQDLKNDPHQNAQAWAWARGKGGPSGSLESLHGLYHGLLGGLTLGGHMGRVATAAFDPVFWLHHNQIERIFCIWQAARAADTGGTNWFRDAELAKSELLPFRRGPNPDGEEFWSSKSARKSSTFGHVFEDVKSTPQETKDNFERLYRWSVPKGRIDNDLKPPENMKFLDLSDSEFFPSEVRPKPPQAQATARMAKMSKTLISRAQIPEQVPQSVAAAPKEDFWDWYIDDEVERLALDGAFAIMYFINLEPNQRFDDSQEEWALAPTFAGATYVFAAPREGCDNCGKQAEQAVKVTNTVPITSQLLDFITIGQLESLSPANVREFLIERLRWRVIGVNGNIVDPREMRRDHGLKIGISYKKATAPGEEPEIGRDGDIITSIVARAS